MKNTKSYSRLLWLIIMMLLPLSAVQAQQEEGLVQEPESRVINTDHDRIIKFRPFDIGQISFAYEKLRSERVSNELGISYVYRTYFKDDFPFGLKEADVAGVHIRMSQRHYTSKKRMAPFGFYHGPTFGYRLMIFDKNVFGQEDVPPTDPNYKYVGRLYQNSLDLGYQIGWQLQLGRHFTTEVGIGAGGRIKYARSVGAEELLTENIIGHAVTAERNSAVFVVPLPQVNFSVGYSF